MYVLGMYGHYVQLNRIYYTSLRRVVGVVRTNKKGVGIFAFCPNTAKARLREKYSHSINAGRTLLNLKGPLHHTDRVDYIYNQKGGWFDAVYSMLELKRMTEESKHLVTSVYFQRAYKVATVTYYGYVLPASRTSNQMLQSVIDCLQRLSKWADLPGLSTEEVTSQYLNDYIKHLRQKLYCRAISNNVKHSIDERPLTNGGSNVKSDEQEVDPALGYLQSLGTIYQENQVGLEMVRSSLD
ncbi:hypothetical protein VTL71DRAFT_5029, partial [Oculimacula yallundae]